MGRRGSSRAVIASIAVLVIAAGSACGDDDSASVDGGTTSDGAATSTVDGSSDGTATATAGGSSDGTTAAVGDVDGQGAPATTDGGDDTASTGVAANTVDNGGGDTDDTGAGDIGSDDGVLSVDRWQRHVLDDARPEQAVFIGGGDLDEDGDIDVVTGAFWYANPGTNEGPWPRHELGDPLNNQALVFDLDDDGHLDVLGTEGFGSEANADFAFARGDGSGNLDVTARVAEGEGDFLQGVCAARFDASGPLQVALSWHQADRGIQLLTVPDDPADDTWPWEQIETFSQDEALSCGDIDGDGDVDLLLGTHWLRNDGDDWSLETVSDVDGSPDRNRLEDMDGDGRLDAVVGFEAISVEGTLAWYEQPESLPGSWTEHVIADDVVGPMSVSVADLDGDGDPDVVVGEHDLERPDDARLLVYENTDGAGTSWQVHVVHQGDEHHDGAELVDIDTDGDLDIISIGWGHGRVVLYENLSR